MVAREHPFATVGALLAAGIAAWFGWHWWAIIIAFVVGLGVGAMIDKQVAGR